MRFVPVHFFRVLSTFVCFLCPEEIGSPFSTKSRFIQRGYSSLPAVGHAPDRWMFVDIQTSMELLLRDIFYLADQTLGYLVTDEIWTSKVGGRVACGRLSIKSQIGPCLNVFGAASLRLPKSTSSAHHPGSSGILQFAAVIEWVGAAPGFGRL